MGAFFKERLSRFLSVFHHPRIRPARLVLLVAMAGLIVTFQNCGKKKSNFSVTPPDPSGGVSNNSVYQCMLSQTWSQPLENFQYVMGYSTHLQAMATDASGGLYYSGYGYDASMTLHWFVKKSNDGGANWSRVDDYQLSPGKDAQPAASGILVSGNNIFVSGQAADSGGVLHWIIRRSTNLGLTWTTDSDYQYAAGQKSMGGQIATGTTGTLFTVGTGVDANSKYHAIVRRSTDAGTTWTVVDDFMYGSGNVLSATEVAVSPQGNIYSAGSAQDANAKNHWYVRMGASNGAAWNTVDDFVYSSGFDSSPSATISFDSASSVYVTGSGSDGFGAHWIVRKSTANGLNWTTIDNYQYQTGASSMAAGLFQDTQSNLYVLGTGEDQTQFKEMHFVARKSTDMGMSWSTVEDFVYNPATATNQGTVFSGAAVTGNGNVYTALSATDAGGLWHGLVLSLPCTPTSASPSPTP